MSESKLKNFQNLNLEIKNEIEQTQTLFSQAINLSKKHQFSQSLAIIEEIKNRIENLYRISADLKNSFLVKDSIKDSDHNSYRYDIYFYLNQELKNLKNTLFMTNELVELYMLLSQKS